MATRIAVALLTVATLLAVTTMSTGCSSDESSSPDRPHRAGTATTATTTTIATTTIATTTIATTASTTTTIATTAAPSDDDRARVVAAVAAQRVKVDNNFGPDNPLRRVIVVGRYEPSALDGSDPAAAGGTTIEPPVRDAVEAALSPVHVEWTPDGQEPSVGDATEPGTAVLRLSEPRITGDHAEMRSGLDCGPTCGIDGTDALQHVGGQWTVTGKIGSELVF